MAQYSVNVYAHVEFYRRVEANSEDEAIEKVWHEVYEETKKIHITNFVVDDILATEDDELYN